MSDLEFLEVIRLLGAKDFVASIERLDLKCREVVAGKSVFPSQLSIYALSTIDSLNEGTASLRTRTFWAQLAVMVRLVGEGAARAFLELVLLFRQSVSGQNAIGGGLTLRALVEHSAVLVETSSRISQVRPELARVWLRNRLDEKPSENARAVFNTLYRAAIGSRIDLGVFPMPSVVLGSSAWSNLLDSVEEPHPDLRTRNILTSIESLAKCDGLERVRSFYEVLSELCHPNSASRNTEYLAWGKRRRVLVGPAPGEVNRAVAFVVSAAEYILPPLCLASEEALDGLKRSFRPTMRGDIAGKMEPFPGAIPIAYDDGSIRWIDPGEIPLGDGVGAQLSEVQKRRIEDYRAKLGREAPSTLEESLRDMSLERDPDREIALWELIADVFSMEVKRRNGVSVREGRLLFAACLTGVNAGGKRKDVLAVQPGLVRLKHLDRVLDAVFHEIVARDLA